MSETLNSLLAPIARKEHAEQISKIESEIGELKEMMSKILSGIQNGGVDLWTLAEARELMKR